MKKIPLSLAALLLLFLLQKETSKKPVNSSRSITSPEVPAENLLPPFGSKQITAEGKQETRSSHANALSTVSTSLGALPSHEQKSLWQAFAEARREVRPIPEAWAEHPENQGYDLYAIHPKQKLRSRFGREGVQLTSSSRTHTEADQENTFTAWEARMQIASFAGHAVALGAVPEKSAQQGDRVEYQHTRTLSEWYVNNSDGLEHGYTVASRPGHLPEGAPVEIEVALTGLSAESGSDELIFKNGEETILTYSKLKVFDALGTELTSRMEPTEDGFLLAYHDTHATYPITVDPLIISEESKLTPTDTSVNREDLYGFSVAISGDTAVISAPQAENVVNYTQLLRSGSIYVFIRQETGWVQQQKISFETSDERAGSGSNISISGDTIIVSNYTNHGKGGATVSAKIYTRNAGVWTFQQDLPRYTGVGGEVFISGDTCALVVQNGGGALMNDIIGDNEFGDSVVCIFTRNNSVWTLQQILRASDYSSNGSFGEAVAIDEDTIAVMSNSRAYIFTRSGVMWTQQQRLTPSPPSSNIYFKSISLSADTIVIGASDGFVSQHWESIPGRAYIFTRSDEEWTQQQILTASNPPVSDSFGKSVSISGDTIIVGAPGDSDGGKNSGSAYAFTRSGEMWTQQQKLTANDASIDTGFGYTVAVSGDNLIVGSFYSTHSLISPGGAYAFTHNGEEWINQQELIVSNLSKDDDYGSTLSISGDTVAIGAPDDDSYTSDTGSVYVFTRNSEGWNEQAHLTAHDSGRGARFGKALAILGNTLVVGAPEYHSSNVMYAGSAYIFTRNGSSWALRQKIFASVAEPYDEFGSSIAISSDTIVIGADKKNNTRNDTVAYNTGAAYIFTRSGSLWIEEQQLIAPNFSAGDNFGRSISISGDIVVVGATGDDDAGENAGSVYVFSRNDSAWALEQKLIPEANSDADHFGGSVSISGNTIVVGVSRDDDAGNASGSVHVFTPTEAGLWTRQQKLTADDAAENDTFGGSVSISGNTIVIGASEDDDAGSSSGSAYVFTRDSETWTQRRKLTAHDSAARDRFGRSVAISGDTVVIGATGDDDGGSDSGGVYAFRLLDGTIDLEVTDWQGTVLLNGDSSAAFSTIGTNETAHQLFSLRNVGTFALDLQDISLGGADANDFTLTIPNLSSSSDLAAGELLSYTITFQPTGTNSGDRNATVTIVSNDEDTPNLTFEISGFAMSSTIDSDSDGMNDLAEYRLQALGFEWTETQTDLVSTYYQFASQAGLFTQEEIGEINVASGLVDVDPANGTAALTITLEENGDLGTFESIVADPEKLSVDEEGRLRYELDATDGKKFYRLKAE